jgi:hypothetical protein
MMKVEENTMDTINMNLMNAALIDLIHQVVEQELKDREAPTMDISDYEYEIREIVSDALSSASVTIDI